MPLPISHGLIGASVAILFYPRTCLKHEGLILSWGAFFAISPDFDFLLVWGLHLGDEWHRGLTHSIFFAFVISCLILAGRGFSNLRSAVAYGTAFLSHAVLDFLTTKRGGGVELLYPFSQERLKLGMIGVSEFTHGFYLTEVVRAGLIELVIFVPIFLGIILLRKYLSPVVPTKGTL